MVSQPQHLIATFTESEISVALWMHDGGAEYSLDVLTPKTLVQVDFDAARMESFANLLRAIAHKIIDEKSRRRKA